MPNIKSYSAGENLGLQPSDRASSSALMAGRRVAQQYNEMADATSKTGSEIGGAIRVAGDLGVKYLEHREQSQGAAEYAKVMLGLNNAWNEKLRNTDPNDPSAAGEFHEKVLEPTLQKFREGFMTEGGQKWADHHIDSLRRHMNEKTTADMSTLAGHAAVVNAQQSINTLGALVSGSPDGHTIDMALKTQRENAEAAAGSPNLKGAAGARVKMELLQKGQEQIVKAGIMSAIQRNPEQGLVMAGDPKYAPFIQPAEIRQFEREVRTQQRLAVAEQREAARFRKEQEQYVSDQSVIAVRKTWDQENPEAKPVGRDQLNDMVNRQLLTRRDFEHLVDKFDRMNKEETPAAISQSNYPQILERIRNGEVKNLSEIWGAETKRQITSKDADRLEKIWTQMKTPEGEALNKDVDKFLKGYKPQIDKSIVGTTLDAAGAERFYRFSTAVERKIDEYRKAGKNPHDLFDPTKPDYMGDPKIINQYVSPLDQRVRANAERVRGGPARPPLESFGGQ